MSAPSVVVCLLLSRAPGALAYRPFDSTDASVAEAGKLELELGPLGYYVADDIGVRAARANAEFAGEFRAGLTWAFGLR